MNHFRKTLFAVTIVCSCLLSACDSTIQSVETVRNYYVLDDESDFTQMQTEDPIIYTDIQYDDENELKMDVYMAEEADNSTKRPAVILMHGGGLTKGDKATDNLTKSIATDLAKMGYVTFDVNYRLASKANSTALKNACEDIAAACTYIQNNCEEYGVDPQYIAIGGYSAGALIALEVAYSNNKDIDIDEEAIFAVIDIAGGTLSFGKPESTDPPCLILHGTEDTTVNYSDSQKLQKKLDKAGVDCTLYKMKGLNHIFTTRYDEVITQTANFLYEKLTGKSASIEIISATNPEWINVELRQKNGYTYTVKEVNCVLDGKLDEWNNTDVIVLDQLKDAGDSLPEKDDFYGEVMIGWDKENTGVLYIAATITDDELQNQNASDGKWYNDDCLEIVFDLSMERTAEQLMKWVVGADGKDLSVLADTNNTTVAMQRTGNTTTYELAIDFNKIDSDIRIIKEPFQIGADQLIGLSICYNDGESGVREHQIGWTPGKSSDRTTLGNLKFSD